MARYAWAKAEPEVVMGFWRLGEVLLFCLAGHGLCAQDAAGGVTVRQRTARPPPSRDVKEGCPAAAPPATSDSVASAADFVQLKRTACAAGCPAYTVRIGGDGRVAWTGVSGVEVTGGAAGNIVADDARALLQRIADRGYWRLCGRYVHTPGDGSGAVTTLSIAGHVKQVEDIGQAAPSWLREEDLDIDRVADTHLWRHGGPLQETFGADHLVEDAVMPKTGVTQLMRAAADPAGTAELAKTLALLTDVNAGDSSGWTALMYAAQSGPLEGMQMLLRAGALAEARSNEGETALFAAVTAVDHPEARIKVLRDAGVEVNARDHHGVTPLMVAARLYWRRSQAIATLLQMGADPSKRDDLGRLAVDYLEMGGPARMEGYDGARAMLLKR